MAYLSTKKTAGFSCVRSGTALILLMFAWICTAGSVRLTAQIPGTPPSQQAPTGGPSLPAGASAPVAAQATPSSFQGSVPEGAATSGTIDLTLDDAIQRGLRNNLGIILSGQQTAAARGQRLSQLQALLPDVEGYIREAAMQVDLAAQGLRFPGVPEVVGPFGYTDIRATFAWSLVNVKSLRSYLAAKHDFKAAEFNAQDARDLVVLTVGNAYLLVVSDEARLASVIAQLQTSKISLDQAAANHQAGTAPLLDELRARVDYQNLQQQLIASQNILDKDRLALARTIGMPLDQKFNTADKAPYAAFDQIDVDAAIQQARANRKDLQAMAEQTQSAQELRKGATADRFPTVAANADYGAIGVNVLHSHGTVDANGTVAFPIFREYGLRGEAQQAQAQLDTQRAQLSDKGAQVDADVRDALLDIQSAQKLVEVARSSVELANEVLSQAQQRYAAGVNDNLAVSEAQQSVAQANDQFVASLYQHNIAKLSLARVLGAAGNYKSYLGGK